MKVWKVFLSAMVGFFALTGCISRHERVEVREKDTDRPVVQERVIEKAPDTTINVR